ncbi:MAG: hypothetical protein DRN81_06585 [Thermoproteota archaeon]|nr:MAG: hypothetical protein DRN81_06585 [Candidatus Korarchaeota archaeon]
MLITYLILTSQKLTFIKQRRYLLFSATLSLIRERTAMFPPLFLKEFTRAQRVKTHVISKEPTGGDKLYIPDILK